MDPTQQAEVEQLDDRVPTAVVVVHGMGEQRPLDTLKGFVQTALIPVDGNRWDYYYSRPAVITDSYEARRYIAPALGRRDAPVQGQTEIFEYHWSYLMTGNRLGDLFACTARLLLQRPRFVPSGLLGVWRIAWSVIVATLLVGIVWILVRNHLPGWISVIAGSAVFLAAVGLLLRTARSFITSSFVDVVRYLDTSPRSYAARRAIRGGLVDLLHGLHDEGRFSRIIVVAHSLGGFIAYDALMSLWAEMHSVHAGPSDPPQQEQVPLAGLAELQEYAQQLLAAEAAGPAATAAPGSEPPATAESYQDHQFVLWQGLRQQGNPWRVTDFISVGTPMTFADLLVTRPGLFSGLGTGRASRALFGDMVRQAELVRCPPRSETQHVEDPPSVPSGVRYSSSRSSARQVLGSQSLFAVVRWTNLWFPVERGKVQGDWFGGPMQPLFGPGVRDIEVRGNLPGRLAPGIAHARYFHYPCDNNPGDIAPLIRQALDLGMHVPLVDLLTAPPPDPSTGGRRVGQK